MNSSSATRPLLLADRRVAISANFPTSFHHFLSATVVRQTHPHVALPFSQANDLNLLLQKTGCASVCVDKCPQSYLLYAHTHTCKARCVQKGRTVLKLRSLAILSFNYRFRTPFGS